MQKGGAGPVVSEYCKTLKFRKHLIFAQIREGVPQNKRNGLIREILVSRK